jgi:hypothetical protein
VTRRPHGAKPQVKGAQGPAGHGVGPRHGGYIHTSVHKSILCPRVSENWEAWPAGRVDGRLAIHHLHTNSIKSVEADLYLYIRILMVEFRHMTLFLYFSTCKGSSLVVEAQEKPCRESRVEFCLHSSSGSSLRDR